MACGIHGCLWPENTWQFRWPAQVRGSLLSGFYRPYKQSDCGALGVLAFPLVLGTPSATQLAHWCQVRGMVT